MKQAEVKTFSQLSDQLLSFRNELALAHRSATQDTWPAMRNEVLSRWDAMYLDDIEY